MRRLGSPSPPSGSSSASALVAAGVSALVTLADRGAASPEFLAAGYLYIWAGAQMLPWLYRIPYVIVHPDWQRSRQHRVWELICAGLASAPVVYVGDTFVPSFRVLWALGAVAVVANCALGLLIFSSYLYEALRRPRRSMHGEGRRDSCASS
jgi:hypothetical protein